MTGKRLDSIYTAENIRLFDLLFRHQSFLEGLKANLAAEFRTMLVALYQEFAKYIGQMRYTSMDQFTKAELNNFIRRFNNAQAESYNQYTESLVKILKQFLSADVEIATLIAHDVIGQFPTQIPTLRKSISPEAYRKLDSDLRSYYIAASNGSYILTPQAEQEQEANSIYGDSSITGTNESDASLWVAITSDPIPANGQLVEPAIARFSSMAQFAVVALIRQGYANSWTPSQLTQALAGVAENKFKDGLFSKLLGQNAAAVNTIVQHISNSVQAAVFSAAFQYYEWVSILDNRTTEICWDRNGNIYKYGEGPLPPAHYNCRSKAIPRVGNEKHQVPSSYASWLDTQPEDVQISIRANEPLTVSEFASKISEILAA